MSDKVQVVFRFIDPEDEDSPYYNWGDDRLDWKAVGEAVEYLDKNLRKWRIDVRQSKEKFGTVRIYCSLGIQWWPQITHPGSVWYRWPEYLKFIAYPGKYSPFRWLLRLTNIVAVPIHLWAYRRYYRKAVEQWPHIKDQILSDADWPQLLEGL